MITFEELRYAAKNMSEDELSSIYLSRNITEIIASSLFNIDINDMDKIEDFISEVDDSLYIKDGMICSTIVDEKIKEIEKEEAINDIIDCVNEFNNRKIDRATLDKELIHLSRYLKN